MPTPLTLCCSPPPPGFFGALLALICQHLSMVDVVLLLHGRCQPLQRLQPLLRRCFRQRYLGGREPTDANVRVSTHTLPPNPPPDTVTFPTSPGLLPSVLEVAGLS